jgi:C4-dicarboxylate transporter, DctM subunit
VTAIAIITLLVVMLLIGVPIGFAMICAAAFGVWWLTGSWLMVHTIASTTLYSSVADYTLTSVPMFILMAYVISQSGIAKDLFAAAANWLSFMRGGLALGTLVATSIFGAMSGASVAAAAVMSEIAVPQMRKAGYSEELSTGVVAVGATTDVLIPPSIALIIYGILTDTSIGALLVAGILPGVLLAVMIGAVIVTWVTVNPSIAPPTQAVSWSDRWASLSAIWPSLLLILTVMFLLYSGFATPTEIGALGAFMAIILAALLGRLSIAGLKYALAKTIKATAMIFIIFIGAKFFGYFLTMTQSPQALVDIVIGLEMNRWLVIIGITAAYFVLSMFMDEMPLMMLTLPLTFPVVMALDFDPVWFGILTMMMVAMGLVFPPVGMLAFVVSGASRIDLVKVYKGCSVLIVAIFATTALLMIFPDIALYLPRAMR